MINIKINENLKQLAEQVAEEMLNQDLVEKELLVPGTEIKLFLVKDNTDRAIELNEIPGSFLGVSINYKNRDFLIFRTTKVIKLSSFPKNSNRNLVISKLVFSLLPPIL